MRKLNILLAAGIGDAWGACFEYAPQRVIDSRIHEWSYFPHHKYNMGSGRYTDDLQMHIAVAEVLSGHENYDEHIFTEAFVRAFRRDPREGYAGRFYEFLKTVKDAEDFAERIQNNSEKSGAAMRAACIGIFGNTEQVMNVSRIQARVTHDTPLGIGAAQAAALMLHYLLYEKGPRDRLPEFLMKHVPVADWTDLPRVKTGHLGVESVKTALCALISENSLQNILRETVSCGGDTDTAATIAMAAGSCAGDIDQTIPNELVAGFENGPFGRDYVQVLDNRLTELARKQGAPV